MSELVDRLVGEVSEIIEEAVGHQANPDLAGLPRTLKKLPPSAPVPAPSLDVVDEWLRPAVDNAPSPWAALAQLVGEAANELPWYEAYKNLEPSPGLLAFQPRYSFTLLAGPLVKGYRAPVLGDDLLLGFSLQAPNVVYPAHHHEAPEIYGVISGSLEWQVGDTWAAKQPGDVIVHRPHESHAMRTGDEPVLTWVAWPHSAQCHVYMPSLDPTDHTMDPVSY